MPKHLKLSLEVIWRCHPWGIFTGSFKGSNSGDDSGGPFIGDHSGEVFREGYSEGFIQEGLIQESSLKWIIQSGSFRRGHPRGHSGSFRRESILRGSFREGHWMQVVLVCFPYQNNTILSKDSNVTSYSYRSLHVVSSFLGLCHLFTERFSF